MAVIGWLQVINAALALAAKPNSKVAQDNMDLFKEQWEKQVRVLTDAVDDITSIDDFLSVSGKFLLLCLSPKSKFQVLLVLYLIFTKNFFMQSHFHAVLQNSVWNVRPFWWEMLIFPLTLKSIELS